MDVFLIPLLPMGVPFLVQIVVAAISEGVQVALITSGVGATGLFIGAVGGRIWDSRAKRQDRALADQKTAVDQSAAVRVQEIQDAASTRAELWAEIRSLREKVTQMGSAYDSLVRSSAEQAAEVKFLSRQVTHLTDMLSDTKADRDRLQRRVDDLETENDALRLELTQVQQESQSQKIQHAQELDRMRQQIEQLQIQLNGGPKL